MTDDLPRIELQLEACVHALYHARFIRFAEAADAFTTIELACAQVRADLHEDQALDEAEEEARVDQINSAAYI